MHILFHCVLRVKNSIAVIGACSELIPLHSCLPVKNCPDSFCSFLIRHGGGIQLASSVSPIYNAWQDRNDIAFLWKPTSWSIFMSECYFGLLKNASTFSITVHSSSANLPRSQQPAAWSIRTVIEMLMPQCQGTIDEVRDAFLWDHFQGCLSASYKSLPLKVKVILEGKGKGWSESKKGGNVEHQNCCY